jgi:hypothetical protein
VMTALQLAAARLAGVNLIFHTADNTGEKDFAAGEAAFTKAADGADGARFLKRIEAAKYQLGTSDGN